MFVFYRASLDTCIRVKHNFFAYHLVVLLQVKFWAYWILDVWLKQGTSILAVTESCFYSIMALPPPFSYLGGNKAGMHWKLGGNSARRAGPNWTRGYCVPYGVSSAKKGKEEKKEMFVVMVFVFTNSHFMCWGSALHSWLITCLLRGSSELIAFCFASVNSFSLTYFTTLSQSIRLLRCFLLSPYPMEEGSKEIEGLC